MVEATDPVRSSDPQARRPPTPKGRDTRQRILDSATALFADRGYANVRISDITAAAGLSPGAFYRYFTDRRELMLELLRALTADVFDFVRVPWDQQAPVKSVYASTTRYFDFYAENQALFGILVELAQTDPEVAAIWSSSRQDFYGRIAHSIERGIEHGALRGDLDVEVAAELLGSMTEFYAFQRFVLGGGAVKPVPLESVARTITDLWVRGTSADLSGPLPRR